MTTIIVIPIPAKMAPLVLILKQITIAIVLKDGKEKTAVYPDCSATIHPVTMVSELSLFYLTIGKIEIL